MLVEASLKFPFSKIVSLDLVRVVLIVEHLAAGSKMASRGEVNNVINVFNIFVISEEGGSSTDVRRKVQQGLQLACEAAVQGLAGSSSSWADSREFQQTSRIDPRIQGPARQVQQYGEVRHDQPKLPNLKPLKPSVVHIEESGGTGSGFIVDAERKLLVTNMHVHGGGKNLEVTIWDEDEQPKFYQAKLVDYSHTLDLALLVLVHCYHKGLTAVRFGSSQSLELMQPVFTIGDPLNVGKTVTTGRISALPSRPITVGKSVIHGAIQLDANINEGNSGGPLFNWDCEVIGVVSSGISRTGIAYAIPADTVKQWMDKRLQVVDDRQLNDMGSSDVEPDESSDIDLDASDDYLDEWSSDDEIRSVGSSRPSFSNWQQNQRGSSSSAAQFSNQGNQRGPRSSLVGNQRTIAGSRSTYRNTSAFTRR